MLVGIDPCHPQLVQNELPIYVSIRDAGVLAGSTHLFDCAAPKFKHLEDILSLLELCVF
jgi:hypothetical protein